MKKNKKVIVLTALSALSLGAVAAVALGTHNSNQLASLSASESRTFTLDLSVAHEFSDGVANVFASGEYTGENNVAFRLTKVSSKEDALTVQNNKTRFRLGDSLENTSKLSGITSIKVNGGNGYFDLYAGYSQDKMYKFLEAESSSGDRIFNNIPQLNYFKLVGKYDNYTCDISSIEFTYSYTAEGCDYGNETALASLTTYSGSFSKGTNSLVVSDGKISINDVDYAYAGVFYNGKVVYAKSAEDVVLVGFDNENQLSVVDAKDRYSSITGTYVAAKAATTISMSVNGANAEATSETNRHQLIVGQTFTFEATSDSVPAKAVNVQLVDESYVENDSDTFVGTYTLNSTITVTEYSMTGEEFELEITKLVVTKENGQYKIEYADNPGENSFYEGLNGTFDAQLDGELLTFIEGAVIVTISPESGHEICFMYYDEDEGYYADGSLNSTFVPASPAALPTAKFENGTFTAINAGNAKLVCSVDEVTATYYVEVIPETFHLELAGNYKTSFNVGDTFTFGGKVNYVSNKGTSTNVTNKVTFSGYNLNNVGKQTVTVSYEGLTVQYEIEVNAVAQASLAGTKWQLDDFVLEFSATADLSKADQNKIVGTFTYDDYGIEANVYLYNLNGNEYLFQVYNDGEAYLTINVDDDSNITTAVLDDSEGALYLYDTIEIESITQLA